MTRTELFDFFWQSHSSVTPDARRIHALLRERGEAVVNDHVAFRTFDVDAIGIESLGATFTALGWSPSGEYSFPEKKLRAISYAHPEKDVPHVFISELITGEFSDDLRRIVAGLVGQIDPARKGDASLLSELPSWAPVAYADYRRLQEESQYAAWLAAYGIRVNHFTVLVNALTTFGSIQELNAWLRERGFTLNDSGGLVKGTPEQLLEQSSTRSNVVEWEFAGGERHEIPSCYYEFARRYDDPATGELYRGFIARSADRIFESTDDVRAARP